MKKFKIIAGPCVIEKWEIMEQIVLKLLEETKKYDFEFIFKASFDKANRSSIDSYRGPGLDEGLKILSKLKSKYNLKIVTDIHEPFQASEVAKVVDVIQIPAFLCRQTDLLLESGKTGKTINIKKAQFLAPESMIHVIKKIESTGNKNIMLTERGTMNGFGGLVVDMTSIMKLKEFGYPVIIDATHSVQKPSIGGKTTGGNRDFAPYIAYAATSVGADGVFLEVHPNPEEALSDGPNSVYLESIPVVFKRINDLRNLYNSYEGNTKA